MYTLRYNLECRDWRKSREVQWKCKIENPWKFSFLWRWTPLFAPNDYRHSEAWRYKHAQLREFRCMFGGTKKMNRRISIVHFELHLLLCVSDIVSSNKFTGRCLTPRSRCGALRSVYVSPANFHALIQWNQHRPLELLLLFCSKGLSVSVRMAVSRLDLLSLCCTALLEWWLVLALWVLIK